MGRRAVVREVLAAREFRALWAGELLSVAGDQVVRVGLAVLVYRETSSAAWAALAYALTFLPALFGGLLLGRLADRYPARALIAVGNLARATVAGLLVLPLPVPLLLMLTCALALGAGPVRAARRALLPERPAGPKYAIRTSATLAAQVAGLLAGGALLVFVDPRLVPGLAAVLFAAAAGAVLLGMTHRPAGRDAAPPTREVAALVWRDRRLRVLVALSWLGGVFVLPAALAAPYAAGLGSATAAVGLLMAALPLGGAVGAWLANRVPERRRPATVGALAVAAGAPLAACLLDPPLAVVVVLWGVSGACAVGYLLLAQALLVCGAPEQYREAISGLARAGAVSSLSVAVLGAGLLADATSPVSAVGAGGITGAVLTAVVGMSWLRVRRGHAATGHNGVVTSPKPASSLPPPVGDVAVDGASSLTSPMPASLTPPSTEPAAERSNGTRFGHAGLTNPMPASPAPPSVGSAAEHGSEGADQVGKSRSHKSASLSTDQRSRRPARWALWREPPRLLVLILVVEVVAASLTGYLAVHTRITAADLVTLAVLVGLALSMGELTRHVERVRRRFNDTPHVNLTSVWTVAAVLVLPAALLPVLIGSMYVHLFWRSWYRVRSVHAYRLVFTSSTVILAAYAASGLRHLLAPPGVVHWDNPVAIVAVVLAGLVYTGVNWGLVVIAITLHERRLSMRKALGTGREAALEFGTIGLGAITGLLVSLHPGWALLIVPALLVLHRSVLMRQLEEAASTDQKTGLANATAWTNMASAEIQRAKRDETQVGVLMVDLDHFKQVNDMHGHLVGDRVLLAVAGALTACARRYDVVGRWGGEEFVMLCPEVSDDSLRQIGERICERVRDLRVPLSEPGDGLAVDGLSVSVGIAIYPEFGPDLQDVLLAADDALFVAKDSGRNQVQTIIAAIGDLSAPRAPSQGS
ncbi:MAG: MFS transporter [Actinophytocola sp.]|uniref:MFS transporter n=1 Tax=Actinophytocola sp. TaxID=1872138 RepID=UPI003D6C07FD